jgi:hypothetical protein
MENSNNKLNKYIESKLHPSEIEYLNNNLTKIISLIKLCQNNSKNNNNEYTFIFLFAGEAGSEIFILHKLKELNLNIKKIYLISNYLLNNIVYINNIKEIFYTFLNKKTSIEMHTFETFNNLYFFSQTRNNIINENIICFAINSQLAYENKINRNKVNNNIANFFRYWINTYKKKIICIKTGDNYNPKIINNINGNTDKLLIKFFFDLIK